MLRLRVRLPPIPPLSQSERIEVLIDNDLKKGSSEVERLARPIRIAGTSRAGRSVASSKLASSSRS